MLPLRTLPRTALAAVLPARTSLRLYSSHGKEVTSSDPPKPPQPAPNASVTNTVETSTAGATLDGTYAESVADALKMRAMQAPNAKGVWSRSQRPREEAMVGPRFEQMFMKDQPQPYSAMELIHKQPVRWRKERVISCDGGGGPLGHPRVFINLDKPQINDCTYCGLPYANEHHRKAIEAKGNAQYPLDPIGDPAEINESQRITNEGLGQR